MLITVGDLRQIRSRVSDCVLESGYEIPVQDLWMALTKEVMNMSVMARREDWAILVQSGNLDPERAIEGKKVLVTGYEVQIEALRALQVKTTAIVASVLCSTYRSQFVV
jgi:hypothetical protein